jgi:hypothetical protein
MIKNLFGYMEITFSMIGLRRMVLCWMTNGQEGSMVLMGIPFINKIIQRLNFLLLVEKIGPIKQLT